MSGFVATADTTPALTVTNDGWWPDLDMTHARDVLRIDGTVTDARLRAALVGAIAGTNHELVCWKTLQVAAGAANLAAVDAPVLDGASRYVALYQRAIYSTAHADLLERYRNLDTTDAGQRRAVDQADVIGEQRRNARWAISDFLGTGRTTVELI